MCDSFFFSSRRRHTRSLRDWSSDVCSSDLIEAAASGVPVVASGSRTGGGVVVPGETGVLVPDYGVDSIAEAVAELLQDADQIEERRVGKECRCRGAP